jgi:hypothetical protein
MVTASGRCVRQVLQKAIYNSGTIFEYDLHYGQTGNTSQA